MTIPTAVDIISRRAPLAAMYDHPVAVHRARGVPQPCRCRVCNEMERRSSA